MKYTFVSIFPELIKPYFQHSILARALDNKLIEIGFYNPRDFTENKYLKVDDYKLGGGAGLLMQIEPLFNCLNHIYQKDKNTHFVFAQPSAKQFNQNDAKRLSHKEHICFVCGRYEGIDERVVEYFANEVFSLGDFILTGGELASLSFCDAISRNINNVLGNNESLIEESFENNLLEAPSFAKPLIFEKNQLKLKSNSVFIKGNHTKITLLKKNLATFKTKFFRPDLFIKYQAFSRIYHEK